MKINNHILLVLIIISVVVFSSCEGTEDKNELVVVSWGGKYQTELFNNLPKKMMWKTFKLILIYLESLNKIVINKDGTITWIWNPKLVEKYLNNKNLEVKI